MSDAKPKREDRTMSIADRAGLGCAGNTEANVTEMFVTPTGELEVTAARLAEEIAVEESTLDDLKEQVKQGEAEVKAKKAELATLLMQAGMDSIKLTCGLTPKVKIRRRFYKQAGITDEDLHTWLAEAKLADIIVPYVHFQTLQSTLAQHEEQGQNIPETIFNVVDEPTVTMYGKSKYLKAKEQEQ